MIYQVILLVALSIGISASKSYKGYKVIQIDLKTDADVELISQLSDEYGADIWKGPSKVVSTDIMLSPASFDPFIASLTEAGLHYKVINDDVQKTIDKEYNSNNLMVLKSYESFKMFSISDHYQTLDEIENWIDGLGKSNNLTTVGVIGRTYEGRSIKYIKVSSGSNRKAILMDGGIHAREWLAVATVNYIIEQIISDFKNGNKDIVNLLSKYDFYFIPVLNPDGYAYTHLPGNRLWRKNRKPHYQCHGTDLNRNFDADFGGAKTSSNPCSDLYGGPYAFSELETVAFARFVQSIQYDLKLYMSLHSYAQFWFVPYAYTSARIADDTELRRVANIGNEALYRVNGVRFKVGIPSQLLYAAAGGSYDWVKLKAGIKYAYTLEVRPEWGSALGGQGFIAPIADIKLSGKEIYAGLVATATAMKN